MANADYEKGRHAFPATERNKDYSGRNFDEFYLAASDALSHSFFNGASLDNCAFVSARLDHVEMAEASVRRTLFRDADLTASDLVRTTVEDSEFVACDFSDGEWRQSQFRRVRFADCMFSHTTINLCSFTECSFSGASTSLDHQSTNYNTFARCEFDHRVKDHLVIARNFGLPAVQGMQPPTRLSPEVTLEDICVMSSTGTVTVAQVVHAIRHECQTPAVRLKKLRLEFMSNIVGVLATARRISPSSLIYIESIFVELARRTSEEADFLAAMAALMNVRNALFAAATDALNITASEASFEGAILSFKSAFETDDVSVFVKALSEIAFGAVADINVVSVTRGSTIIELAFTSLGTMTAFLCGLNLLVSQADALIKGFRKLRRDVRKARPHEPHRGRVLAPAAPVERSKVPAILNPTEVFPQLIAVRHAVERDGNILIYFDEPVEVVLGRVRQKPKRRRKKV